MATQTYQLAELARLLRWNVAHCKVMVKQLGGDPGGPISEDVASKVAGRIRRPWPPQAEATV
ncbi:MAG: hypothetical protein O7F08_10365 [Deltaproteobacteria bacterium]|nr:hypothetical protein [Deltaproteobacteria bacterium]